MHKFAALTSAVLTLNVKDEMDRNFAFSQCTKTAVPSYLRGFSQSGAGDHF